MCSNHSSDRSSYSGRNARSEDSSGNRATNTLRGRSSVVYPGKASRKRPAAIRATSAAPTQEQRPRLHPDEADDAPAPIQMYEGRQLLVVPRALEEDSVEIRVELQRDALPRPEERRPKELQHGGDILPAESPDPFHATPPGQAGLGSPRRAATSCLPLGSRGRASRSSYRAGCMCRGSSKAPY